MPQICLPYFWFGPFLLCIKFIWALVSVVKTEKWIGQNPEAEGKITASFENMKNCNSILTPWNYTFLFERVTQERCEICLIIESDTSPDNRPEFFASECWTSLLWKFPSRWTFTEWICKLRFEIGIIYAANGFKVKSNQLGVHCQLFKFNKNHARFTRYPVEYGKIDNRN